MKKRTAALLIILCFFVLYLSVALNQLYLGFAGLLIMAVLALRLQGKMR